MKKSEIIEKNVWDKSVAVEESSYYWKDSPKIIQRPKLSHDSPIIIELFCGCGGTSIGFEDAGFEVALGIDIHQPSIETFALNHPNAGAILGDVKLINPDLIKDLIGNREVDVLIGGVPCQGFSLNNRKRTTSDKRNLLYKEFLRFVTALQPKSVLLENVSGMKSSGNFAQRIERELTMALGARVSSRLLNAEEYGVPQKRRRLVFVGIKNSIFDFESITKTHGPDIGKQFNTVRDAIGDLPSLTSNSEATRYLQPPQSEYQTLMRRGVRGNVLTNHRAPNHPQDTIARIANTPEGAPMYPAFKQRIRLSWNLPSPTQVSGGIRPQFQFGHPSDARGLTIRERCRLQSFPDHFQVTGGIVQGRVQTGNAVPPLLARAVAISIRKYLDHL